MSKPKQQTTYQFFHEHAGYSYDPKTETKQQGRARCAKALADAERRGREQGLSFAWSVDPDTDSSEFSDEKPAWALWQCVCRDQPGTVRASLHAIDFGRDGFPCASEPYARVVEAELALEVVS